MRFKKGQRVKLTPLGLQFFRNNSFRRYGGKTRGTVAANPQVQEYVSVQRDGLASTQMYASIFWEPVEQEPAMKVYAVVYTYVLENESSLNTTAYMTHAAALADAKTRAEEGLNGIPAEDRGGYNILVTDDAVALHSVESGLDLDRWSVVELEVKE